MTTTLLLIAVLLGIYLNLDSLGQPEELLPLIRPYFAVSLVSIIFVMLYNSFRQFVEGIANPSISMWVLLTGNLLNIIGNYILIYGKYGMPELGLLGAGISTFISRIIMLLLSSPYSCCEPTISLTGKVSLIFVSISRVGEG